MNHKTKLFVVSLILSVSFGLQSLSAQNIDYTNEVEFSDDEVNDDLNSISLISKSKARVVVREEVEEKNEKTETTLTDLAAILESKRLHYRNVRKPAEKCYRESADTCAK